MLIMAIFFKCPLYTYIEVKLKICYYGGFSKIPYFNNKRGVPFIWEFGEWKEVQKTDKNWQVTWCKKEKTVSALSLKYANMIFSSCIYNVIKFFFKKI